MKTFLCLLIGLSMLLTTVQANPNPIDSLKKNQALLMKQSERLMKRSDSIITIMHKMSHTNDSLNKELYYYRAKDDFYVMAVDRQGSHFEWLLATIIGVAGLFSYTFFRRELNKQREEFDNQLNVASEKYKILLDDLRETKIDLFKTISTISTKMVQFDAQNTSYASMSSTLNNVIFRMDYLHKAYKLSEGEGKVHLADELKIDIKHFGLVLDDIEQAYAERADRQEFYDLFRKDNGYVLTLMDKFIYDNNRDISQEAVLTKTRLIYFLK
ncbi:type 2 periplasmic-binding domain-containing protein [Spirosoma endophyticum]|uniref:Uncharacterized protein n=1 Tax=Spirosoma endophyticum TaxID=662367 RepID=A0A1I1SL84_9BACT|nr:hypothetical protein [Spirosoma endophyticum]SFD47171.1 hypothetical protein SAMN05216167_105146 [Spirosoma endophyticum]